MTTDLLPLTAPAARAATTPTSIIVATPIEPRRRKHLQGSGNSQVIGMVVDRSVRP
jgi:hypothetical protein